MPNRYNGLGQILAEGAEVAVARGFQSGWSVLRAGDWLESRYPGIPQDDITQLIEIALAGLAAGALLSSLFPGATASAAGEGASAIIDTIFPPDSHTGVRPGQVPPQLPGPIHGAHNEPLPAGIIPQVAELFGETPDGRQGVIGVKVTDLDTDFSLDITIDLDGTETPDEIMDIAENIYRKIIRDYPDKFKNQSGSDLDNLEVEIGAVFRKY